MAYHGAQDKDKTSGLKVPTLINKTLRIFIFLIDPISSLFFPDLKRWMVIRSRPPNPKTDRGY